MKAGDRSGGQTFSRESWLSAPLSDPNAALWASITPPANPDLATIVRRRAASFSLDLLAQRLYLRFPATFSSRATARIAILCASVAAGAALGVAGYLSLFPRAAPIAASAPVSNTAPSSNSDPPALPSASARARHGQTQLPATAPDTAPTLAATAPSAEPEPIAQPLIPSADIGEPGLATPVKAKRGVAKKRAKATARRASWRRAHTSND